MRELELKAGFEGGLGLDALGGEENLSHFAIKELDGELRRGQKGGAVEGAGEIAGELAVGDRVGGDAIEYSGHRLVFGGESNHADEVVDVDPAHPLFSVAEYAADAGAEERGHGLEGSSVGPEDDADADFDDAEAVFGGAVGLGFPGRTDVG